PYAQQIDWSPDHAAGGKRQRHPVIVKNWLFLVASPRVISDNEEMTHKEAHRARRTGTVH
ncbi:hypothetical protein, partial [Enterobacter oligotrophicus]|uniref:hypothetical protein n=1 Tax=Enterobacter oligotrophicus TaxID=2478464 RepID=UPI0023F53AA4